MEATHLPGILKARQQEFFPVVPFDSSQDRLILLDFSLRNMELTDAILDDTALFTHYIQNKLQEAGARYGIGGYAENRTLYRKSRVFDALLPGAEPRRVHLGMDIWGRPNTAVSAPLDGIIHSFAFNDSFGDYGATIILSHRLGDASFHTLYGHLSLNSLKNCEEGKRIEGGEIFAELGISIENGHWPPHLHFQVIRDLEGYKGDYPGVCAESEKEKWLANCPDPDLILQLNRYIVSGG